MRVWKLGIRLLISGAIIVLPALSSRLLAQAGSGALRGQVTDPSGASVASVTVLAAPAPPASGPSSAAVVKKDGTYEIDGLAPGTYVVSAIAKGFAPFEQQGVVVAAGPARQLNIALKIEQERQQVTVSAEAEHLSVSPENNASALVIKGKELEALSDDPDELQSELQALAGPSAGPNGGQIYIDGFTGGQLPPKAAILEIRVNQNPFSAEYDKLGYGRIEITTKPGFSQYHGEAFVSGNSSAFNSRSPFVTEEPGYHSEFYNGNLGGPLGKKASFFVDFFRRDVNDSSIVNAVILDPNLNQTPFSQAVLNPQTRMNISPRVDLQLSKNNVMTVRYQRWTNSGTDNGIGQFSLASQAFNRNDIEHTLQISDTQVVSARTVNQFRFQYRHENDGTIAQNFDPTISVLGAFTGGGNGMGTNTDTQDNYEVQNLLSMSLGKHSVVFGGRVRHIQESSQSNSGFNGAFTFSSLDAYQTAEQSLALCQANGQTGCETAGASQFSITAGIPLVQVSWLDAGLYGQDDWRVRPNVTLSLGLRWESQNDIPDHSDFAPRLGLAWGIGGGKAPKTVLRAGSGIFYDRFQEGSVLEAERLNGLNQQQYLITAPDFFPVIPSLSALQAGAVTPTVYRIDPTLRAPYTIQSAIGLERQVTKALTASVTYLNSHGVHQLLTNNINAPFPGTYNGCPPGSPASCVPSSGILPFPGESNIYQYESVGLFNENQLIVNANIRAGTRLSLFGFYTYSQAKSDTNGVGSFPSNPYDILADYGPAGFIIRHQAFVGGSIALPKGIRLSPFVVANSGRPFNITVGQDLNGDSIYNDRPAFATAGSSGAAIVATNYGTFNIDPQTGQTIIPPNYVFGPAAFTLNLRLGKTFGFGKEAGGGGGGDHGHWHGGRGGLGGRGLSGGGGGGMFGPPSGENHRYNLELGIMARNVLNKVNLGTPVGNLSSPIFGQSNTLAGGPFNSQAANREISLQMRFSF
ncbi:MAG TPA: carboxypeptidase regulatory-like domain-containing protein [Terriglobia bacterium]|nr:carboxypeptidase regulatory-like domain-containing protein [Terriglobia bacterium]